MPHRPEVDQPGHPVAGEQEVLGPGVAQAGLKVDHHGGGLFQLVADASRLPSGFLDPAQGQPAQVV